MDAAQIAAVARAAGVRDRNNLAVAVAVALAESGGNPAAHNATPPDNSYGLWQINMLGGLGPARRAQLGIATDAALFDPAVNARAMFAISRGGVFWSPWTTFTRGAYLRHLPAARTAADTALTGAPAAGGGGGEGGEAVPGGLPGWVPDIIEVPTDVAMTGAYATMHAVKLMSAGAVWVADRRNWQRVAYVGAGAVLLVAGLLVAGREPLGRIGKATTGAAKKAVNTAAAVTPAGAGKAAAGKAAAGKTAAGKTAAGKAAA